MTVKWNIQAARFVIPAVDKDLAADQIIEITDEEYAALKEGVASGKEIYVDMGKLALRENTKQYPAEYYTQQTTNIEALRMLKQTDWKVIRELERLYLSGTPLNNEREAARSAIITGLPKQE